MKYSELIQFDPIDEIIELRQASKADVAKELVRTFVISEQMADKLNGVVIPELQFQDPKSNMGIFVVGNYGTGKSHLLAFLSAIAEHADLLELVSDEDVREKAKVIAGQFQVTRLEIGAVQRSLRDIICSHLENAMEERGISFAFPSVTEINDNKASLEEMMAAFHAEFPNHGFLIVVDELLDYLRARKDQELAGDLGFLREVGEICKTTRFRFMAGVQESLFDSPVFHFIQQSIRRVKDRFRQVRIAREDVAFVVENRLLKKTTDQQERIRDHLRSFATLYGPMNERLDEFVRLFPVHPAYLDTFEMVYVAEKREVLKTLSREISALLNQDVPQNDPGLIAYDSYWKTLTDNPAFRAITEVKEVLDRSSVLESRIQNAFPNPKYKPLALRIIHGMSVHRLTTGDIHKPIGPTAEELRDNLCLYLEIPEREADFLRTVVEKVLKDIISTANGQFISFNPENGQYYLDLKKDVDFDALIENRAASLSESELDRYYFEALREVVLERPGMAEYVPGYRIWEHELVWCERKAGRPGYLFFGAPNERSTAQPPRDFYVYFIQPYDPPAFKDERKDDEVFFYLNRPDATFEAALRSFAGARAQAITAAGENKTIYEGKATEHLRSLTKWLRGHMTTAFDVVYRGEKATLAENTQNKVSASETESVRDLCNAAASICLATLFSDMAPEYPTFQALLLRDNREQAAAEAIRYIATGHKTKQSAMVLDALELLDGEKVVVRHGRYAKDIMDRLDKKGDGQVVNRAEVLEAVAPDVEYWAPTRFRLEPAFLAVVLAAIVRSGEAVVSVIGQKLDAASTDKLASVGVEAMGQFKHIERPRDLPLAELTALFELLGLNEGLLVQPETRDDAAKALVAESAKRIESVLAARQAVKDGMVFWGSPLLAEPDQERWEGELDRLKAFLESLQPFNTGGKLKNFRLSMEQIKAQEPHLERLAEVLVLHRLLVKLLGSTGYLNTGEAILPEKDPWVAEVKKERIAAQELLRDPKRRTDEKLLAGLHKKLEDLRKSYRTRYIELHGKARLNQPADKKKGMINTDPALKQLRALAGVEGMPSHDLHDFEDRLHGLMPCFMLTEGDIEDKAICPHCSFRPSEEGIPAEGADGVLRRLEEELGRLRDDWTTMILRELEDPTVKQSLELLDGEEAKVVAVFRKTKELPDPVTKTFVSALAQVLAGLEGILVSRDDLLNALLKGGARCTADELRGRLDGILNAMTKGKDPAKVRFVIE